MAPPKVNSGFDVDVDSFNAVAESFKAILGLFHSAGLTEIISTRCKIMDIELTEFKDSIHIADHGSLHWKVSEQDISITEEMLSQTFDLSTGNDPDELTGEEISKILQIMMFRKEKPINLKKVDVAEEYRFLADIVGKVLLCKISAHDAIPKQQLQIMGILVLNKKINWGRCLLKLIAHKYANKENAYMRIMSQVLLHHYPVVCKSKGVPIPPRKRMHIRLFSKWTRQILKPGQEGSSPPPSPPQQDTSFPQDNQPNSPVPPPDSIPVITLQPSTTITENIHATQLSPPQQSPVHQQATSNIPPVITSVLVPSPPPSISTATSTLTFNAEQFIAKAVGMAASTFGDLVMTQSLKFNKKYSQIEKELYGSIDTLLELKSKVSSSMVTKDFLTSLLSKVQKGEMIQEEERLVDIVQEEVGAERKDEEQGKENEKEIPEGNKLIVFQTVLSSVPKEGQPAHGEHIAEDIEDINQYLANSPGKNLNPNTAQVQGELQKNENQSIEDQGVLPAQEPAQNLPEELNQGEPQEGDLLVRWL